MNFVKFLRTTFLEEHLWTAAPNGSNFALPIHYLKQMGLFLLSVDFLLVFFC